MEDSHREDPFYVVWNPEHGLPRVRHQTAGIARQEAERLARIHPGHRFFVLATIGEVVKDDVRWTRHRDEIPF